MKSDQRQHIERLLERFMSGESTLAEERTLSHYFATHEVEPQWRAYKQMFALFDAGLPAESPLAGAQPATTAEALPATPSANTPEGDDARPHKRWLWVKWCSVAASVALLVTVGWRLASNPSSVPVGTDSIAATTPPQVDTPVAAPTPPHATAMPAAEPTPPAAEPAPPHAAATPAAEPAPRQAQATHSAQRRTATRHYAQTIRRSDSVELVHTQAALEMAEQEVIADRILLEQELQRNSAPQSGWVTVSLNVQ